MTKDNWKIDLEVDHYKDTFEYTYQYRSWRDRTFLYLLISIVILLFQLYAPDAATKIFNKTVKELLSLELKIDISFLTSIVWFATLGLSIRYFQAVTTVDRHYDYLHKLEEAISPYFDAPAFTREGNRYIEGYPLFSNWVALVYSILFPCVLLVVVLVKIINEISLAISVTPLLVINCIFAFSTVISIFLYQLFIHFKK